MVNRNNDLSKEMLRLAHLTTPDADEQAVALITAATVIIERQVGRGLAGAALSALIYPTLAGWAAPTLGETKQ